MIPHQYLFRGLLIATCGYALWRGRRDERIVALICLVATVATHAALSPLSVRYARIESGLLLVDLAALASFIFIALRSPRYWPLWIAGFQLTSSMAHAMKAIDIHLMPQAYGTAVALWSYPILIILAVGTWRGRRRKGLEQDIRSAV
jgi:hypothetical protein